jgi:hypothetical protein
MELSPESLEQYNRAFLGTYVSIISAPVSKNRLDLIIDLMLSGTVSFFGGGRVADALNEMCSFFSKSTCPD